MVSSGLFIKSAEVKILLFLFIPTFCGGVAYAQTHDLSVRVVGLQSNRGSVIMTLYNSDAGYPTDESKAIRKCSIPIQNRVAVTTFQNLPRGNYAVACYHDEDGNGKLNTNFLGIPTEGLGASNDAKGFFGPPKFKDAKFQVISDTSITVHIRY